MNELDALSSRSLAGRSSHSRHLSKYGSYILIEQHSVSRIEKGIIAPKMSRLQEIADLLECTVADLFRQTDTPAFAKVQEICHLLEELSPEMQDVVVDLVENTVYTLKKIDKWTYFHNH